MFQKIKFRELVKFSKATQFSKNNPILIWQYLWIIFVHKYGMFLEWWDATIWKHFSRLLDERIAEMREKFNYHNGFFRANQDRAKIFCQIGWIGCPILQVAQKAMVIFHFLLIFLKSSHEKIVNYWKDFLRYSTTL